MSGLRALPSVDRLLGECGALIDAHGRASVTEALRTALAEIRRDPPQPLPDASAILRAVGNVLAAVIKLQVDALAPGAEPDRHRLAHQSGPRAAGG